VLALWSWMWPIGLGAIGAISGWIVVKFVGDPIRKFWDLRGEVSRALHERARFVPGSPETDMMFFKGPSPLNIKPYNVPRDEAVSTFKSLGAQLLTFSSNEFLASAVLQMCRISINRAGRDLVSLALAIDDRDSANAPRCDDILRALRLPTTHVS
jgi:hypothetical protein